MTNRICTHGFLVCRTIVGVPPTSLGGAPSGSVERHYGARSGHRRPLHRAGYRVAGIMVGRELSHGLAPWAAGIRRDDSADRREALQHQLVGARIHRDRGDELFLRSGFGEVPRPPEVDQSIVIRRLDGAIGL